MPNITCPENIRSSHILLVDDDLVSISLLEEIITRAGYNTHKVYNGKEALEYLALTDKQPDLILLDINMPEMNGYEVCNRIKTDTKLQEIPVIFITTLDRIEDKIHGFQLGGADYICKPFQDEEVLARMQVHLSLQQQQRIISENYEKLRKLEGLRDNLVNLIVHDMQSPLATIQCVLDEVINQFSGSQETTYKFLKLASSSTHRLIEMATQMLLISSCESTGSMPIRKSSENLTRIVLKVLDSMEVVAGTKKLVFDTEAPIQVTIDKDIIGRVVSNLISNAIKYGPEDVEILISLTREDQFVRFTVTDRGLGIEKEYHPNIFDKFFQASSNEGIKKHRGFGLGLYFCKLAIEAHGGQIGLISEINQGSTFWFTLPI